MGRTGRQISSPKVARQVLMSKKLICQARGRSLNRKISEQQGGLKHNTYQEHVGSITYGNLGKRRTQCSLTDCLEDGIRTHHVWGQYVQQLRKVVAPLDTTQKTVVVVDAGATMSMEMKILEVMRAAMFHSAIMAIE